MKRLITKTTYCPSQFLMYSIILTYPSLQILELNLKFSRLKLTLQKICINWNLKEPINIPSGKLSVKESLGKGLDKQYIEKGAIIKARIGGEKCKPFGRNKSQKIKNLFQEFEVPDWKRDGIPIIYINERIAAVGDLWVCEEFHTSLHEKGVSIIWNQMIS